MKIRQLTFQRYKRFRDFKLDFHADDPSSGASEVFLLVGDNGSGKSSVLQAIAAMLGTATKQISSPDKLMWPGFAFDTLSASYRGYSNVRLTVEFDEKELRATQEFYDESDYSKSANNVRPASEPMVTLVWNTDPEARYPVSAEPLGTQYFVQFQGRRYAYNLLYRRIPKPEMFTRIGGVFWYTDHRTSHSLAPFEAEGNGDAPIRQIDTLPGIRQLFAKWFAANNKKVEKFNDYYGKLFPNRKLGGVTDVYGDSLPQIFFDDGKNQYDVEELSAGERALMPILLDFVEWGINNSVVLIDELELHLHPPLQQALFTLLPKLGVNNQFIVTTHSDHIANLSAHDFIKRVDIP